jgi:hypothetical protein
MRVRLSPPAAQLLVVEPLAAPNWPLLRLWRELQRQANTKPPRPQRLQPEAEKRQTPERVRFNYD